MIIIYYASEITSNNISVEKYYTRKDLSFKAWLNNKNKITESQIVKDYCSANKNIDEDIKKTENIIYNLKNKKLTKDLIYNRAKRQLDDLKLIKKDLQKLKNEDIKILNKENKKIRKWKNFKKLLKKIEIAVDIAKSDLNIVGMSLKVEENFLSDFKKYTNKNDVNYILGADFNEQCKKLIKESKKFFKQNNLIFSNYLPSESNLLRKFLSFFGSKSKTNTRESMSDTTDKCNYSNMFEGIDPKMRLTDIVILEAHDAGSYEMAPVSSTDVFGQGAQTQAGNITSMLKSGARCFDLRVKLVKNVPVFYHGIVKGGNFIDAATQITKFLKSYKKEIVIIRLKASDKCVDTIKNIIKLKEFLNLIYYPSKDKTSAEITIEEMLESDKRILILRREGKVENFCMGQEDIDSHYKKSVATSGDSNYRLKHEETFLENKNKNRFTVSSEVRTPSKRNYLSIPLRKILSKSYFSTHAPLKEAKQNIDSEDKFFKMDSVKKFANIIGIDDITSKSNRAKIVKEWNKARSDAFKKQNDQKN